MECPSNDELELTTALLVIICSGMVSYWICSILNR